MSDCVCVYVRARVHPNNAPHHISRPVCFYCRSFCARDIIKLVRNSSVLVTGTVHTLHTPINIRLGSEVVLSRVANYFALGVLDII